LLRIDDTSSLGDLIRKHRQFSFSCPFSRHAVTAD
jgi:hypothetical protein